MLSIRTRSELAEALEDLPEGLVFEAVDVGNRWDDTMAELQAAFEASIPAATGQAPVVYIVSSDALLGRTGSGNAMVATALLSGARTLAVELRKSATPVNVIGVTADTPTDEIAHWVRTLTRRSAGPTGELIQLGGTQIGKALP